MELRDSYNKNGYVIVKNIINTQDVENIFDIFIKYLNSKKLISFIPKNLNDLLLHNSLIELRKNNSTAFSMLYDSM